MNWQPIETAPRDGRLVLVWLSDGERPDVMRADDLQHRCKYSWMEGITHWMPLPNPPEAP